MISITKGDLVKYNYQGLNVSAFSEFGKSIIFLVISKPYTVVVGGDGPDHVARFVFVKLVDVARGERRAVAVDRLKRISQ